MRAILNRHMFTTRVFDSGALGVLGSVIHQFREPGRYEVVIRQKDSVVRSFRFEASESSSNMQLDIDLASVIRAATGAKEDCGCDGAKGATGPGVLPTVSPKGYVLFYVSQGDGGYAVSVGREGGEKPVFDSTALGEGDIFAVTLLAPTRYAMTNRTGGAKGTIVVSSSSDTAKSLAAMSASYVETRREAFAPNTVKVVSGQGIVFRILETSRVVIEQQEEPESEARAGGKGKRRFYARPQIPSSKSAQK
jgi:hypothetical protein